MAIEILIKNLESNLQKQHIHPNNLENSIIIINRIFNEIKNNDEFYNLFLEELNQNFIIYFKNLVKDLSNKNFKIDHNKDELIKQKFSTSIVSEKLLTKIKNLIKVEVETLKKREQEKKLSRSELTISGGLKVIRIIKLLNKEFSKNGHLESVSNYLGYKSIVNGLAIELSSEKSSWWKHKKDSSQPKTLAVHLDKEFTCVKSILYLTDVTSNNGPFTVYPNIYDDLNLNIFQDIIGRIILETASNIKNYKLRKYLDIKDINQPFLSENLRKIYSKIPKNISFNSHFGWELEAGSELEEKIEKNKKIILGNAGTIITFDGSRLLHSGGLVLKDRRLALQVIYSKKNNEFIKYLKKFKKKFF